MIQKCFKLKSEEEQLNDLEERKQNQDRKIYGRDGKIIAGEKKFVYKKIEYLVKVLRYYNLDDGFTKLGNRLTSFHAVVEPTEKSQELKSVIDKIDDWSEFLYHDTLHSWNDKQDLDEQIQECHRLARKDINRLGTHYFKLIEDRIQKLINIKTELRSSVTTTK